MELTFDRICEKLGFNPLVNPPDRKLSGYEDDSKESPYAVLTFEESDFLCEYLKNNRVKQKFHGISRTWNQIELNFGGLIMLL